MELSPRCRYDTENDLEYNQKILIRSAKVMAKVRMLNTRFWGDTYVSDLDPTEKLLFLFLLTNSATNICGIYEISLKMISLETGIEKEMVQKVLDRFTRDEKIFYIKKKWICIKNFVKHQNFKSPQMQKGIENELSLVPKDILDEAIRYGYGIYTTSHFNLNINIKDISKDISIASESSDAEVQNQDKKNPDRAVTLDSSPSLGSQVNELINLFKPVNPLYGELFQRKVQRKACEILISKFGFERMCAIVKSLEENLSDPYAPNITTPKILENKFANLITYAKRKKEKQKV